MMALVAYDNSDSSDYEENCDESLPITLNPKNESNKTIGLEIEDSIEPATQTNTIKRSISEEPEAPQNLFNQLPQPSHKKTAVIEEDDEFLHKKETISDVKPKSKITVPSLSDFKDVKDTIPSARPKISNGKKSGLLSILPQPKHSANSSVTSKMLIPQVVSQKPTSTAKKKVPLPSSSKKTQIEKKASSKVISYSDDSDEEVTNDFFSINKPVEVPLEELPLDLDLPSSSKARDVPTPNPRSIESYFKQESVENQIEEQNNIEMDNATYNAQKSGYLADNTTPSGSSEIALDEEAIVKLCGTRGKRKREEIQIVDVNQQEVLADAREWLLKGLMEDTSKRVSASKKRGNEPTSQQKRVHQITYLAHQAKANEIELQNRWANNRMTKRQTQSKYGF